MQQGRFEYKLLVKYPHLADEDIITWEKYVQNNPKAYDSVDYDFALSQVKEATAEAVKLDIAGAERVFKYRADVIGYRDKEIHIIELKNKATPGVIGHLLTEKLLYDRDEKPTLPTKMIVIAREMTPELDILAEAQGVKLILV
jgi:hypothetical protein